MSFEPGARLPALSSIRQRRSTRRAITYALISIWTILMGFPIYWMLSTALKTEARANAYPPQWLPDPVQWRNFYDSMTAANFGRYFLNSTVVSLAAVVFVLFFS